MLQQRLNILPPHKKIIIDNYKNPSTVSFLSIIILSFFGNVSDMLIDFKLSVKNTHFTGCLKYSITPAKFSQPYQNHTICDFCHSHELRARAV